MTRLYDPSVFQGNLKEKRYFEGWYHKHSVGNEAYVFIPGIRIDAGGRGEAFIQMARTNSLQTANIVYPLDSVKYSRKNYEVHIGENTFSDRGMFLNIENESFCMKGVKFSVSQAIIQPDYPFIHHRMRKQPFQSAKVLWRWTSGFGPATGLISGPLWTAV